MGRERNDSFMKRPVLVIMAAGMGSRYGGLKQIDPIDREGHIIIDFSIYDARRAGFEKVVFIIKKDNEEEFKEVIGNRISKFMDVAYAFQELSNIPENYQVPDGRKKPWGTAHAVLSAADKIDGPFAVINADGFYTFQFTLFPLLLCTPILLVFAWLIPVLCFRNLEKQSIVERLRAID